GELHPVGDLVQAYPQAEVLRVDAQLPLDRDQVRGHQHQLPVRPVEELELAQHLAGEEAQYGTGLNSGDSSADRLRYSADLVVGGETLDQRRHDGAQPGGVHVYPALAVDDARERGDRRFDQTGQLGNVRRGLCSVAGQLGDRVVRFGP